MSVADVMEMIITTPDGMFSRVVWSVVKPNDWIMSWYCVPKPFCKFLIEIFSIFRCELGGRRTR
jgi:hypothetical protein